MKNKNLPVAIDKATTQKIEEKMTIQEYQEKYTRMESAKQAKHFIRFLVLIIGTFLFGMLALLCLRIFDINLYAGIVASVVCVIIYIFIFVIPVVKILKSSYFITNVNSQSAKMAKRHNKKLRRQIADKMIEINATLEGVHWYDDALVGDLAIAVHQNDDKTIKSILTDIYDKSVKTNAHSIIRKSALQAGTFAAISQSSTIDAALVATVNLQLIKDLVFLYGFRPSDAKLVRIFWRVVRNSLVAYGVSNIKFGSSVSGMMGNVFKGLPVLGNAISTVVDSSVQGMTNATMTLIIGNQTMRYLAKEYHLQDILDNIDLPDNDEVEKECKEIETELKHSNKK